MVEPMKAGEAAARLFHDTYERLAPQFGYETRADTKQFDPESANGRLMTAVCSEVLAAMPAHPTGEVGDIVERLRSETWPESEISRARYKTRAELFNDCLEAADLIQSLQSRLSISEGNVERVAREALFGVELARTGYVDRAFYFYVTFAGQRIEFKPPWHDDPDALRGPMDHEMAELSAKAAAGASAINDLLFDLAKRSVRAALASLGGVG